MYELDYSNPIKVHFMGIGGISMSGLAEILKDRGFTVSGSDRAPSDITKSLEAKGIKVFYGQVKENITDDIELLVYTAAISADNEELLEAKNRGIECIPRADMLGQIMKNYEVPIAISGTHGKTTTTSMITSILMEAAFDPTVTVGGTVQLSATALSEDAHDRSISWSSSDNSIVTVNQSGLVSAVAAGTAVIKATAYDGSGVYAPVSITSTAPARTITVTYAPGLYGAGTAPASSTTTTGSVTLPGASFTRSGYTQSGWSVNIAGDVGTYSLSATIPVTADMTLYPYWTSVTPQLYYVTYEKGTYGTGTTVTSSAVSLGSQLKLFDKGFFTRTGYVQDGWSISPDGTMADYALQGTITLYGPITLYPHWTAESANRTIYVDYSDNGSVYYGDVKVSKGQTLTITPGKTITLSFKPNDKYYVYNVNVSGYNYSSRDSYTFSYDEMNANKSIFVRFESVYVNPKTGDDSNVFLWAVLGLSAVACGAGSFAVVLKKREE